MRGNIWIRVFWIEIKKTTPYSNNLTLMGQIAPNLHDIVRIVKTSQELPLCGYHTTLDKLLSSPLRYAFS